MASLSLSFCACAASLSSAAALPSAHPGELATKVRYFGVKSTKVLREQMGT